MPGADPRSRWYRQPVLWLGAVVFVASLAGCVWIIAMGARHADVPVEAPHAVFGVPSHGHAPPAPAGTAASPR